MFYDITHSIINVGNQTFYQSNELVFGPLTFLMYYDELDELFGRELDGVQYCITGQDPSERH